MDNGYAGLLVLPLPWNNYPEYLGVCCKSIGFTSTLEQMPSTLCSIFWYFSKSTRLTYVLVHLE